MTMQPDQDNSDTIIARLRRMPEMTPPSSLRGSIMASLAPRKPGWRTVLRRFLFAPRTITFVPIKWAPVLAGLLVLAVLPRLTALDRQKDLVAESAPAAQATLTFTFQHREARQVALIGTFNNWTPDRGVETKKQGDLWIFRLNVDPGRHEYAFLVNGRDIVADPRAVFHRDNGFGIPNSIVYATANGHNAI